MLGGSRFDGWAKITSDKDEVVLKNGTYPWLAYYSKILCANEKLDLYGGKTLKNGVALISGLTLHTHHHTLQKVFIGSTLETIKSMLLAIR